MRCQKCLIVALQCGDQALQLIRAIQVHARDANMRIASMDDYRIRKTNPVLKPSTVAEGMVGGMPKVELLMVETEP
jgi:hypothetical protein